jgi:hypothetical protein
VGRRASVGQRRVEAIQRQHPAEELVGRLAVGEEGAQELAVLAGAGEALAQRGQERGVERGLIGHRLLLEAAAGGEGLVGQDPLAEAVDRGDRGGVDAIEGVAQAAAGHRVEGPGRGVGRGRRRRAPHHLGQEPADARAQLGGGLVGVGDDHDAIDRGVGAEQEIDDLVLEEVGLAGAGRGLDDL